MSNQPIDEFQIAKSHELTWRRLWIIYRSNDGLLKSWALIISFVCAFASIVSAFLLGKDLFKLIIYTSEQMVNIMPDILGFNLGAYVLLIGLNSQNILNEITTPMKGERFSLFQKMSSVFAVSILIQAIALILSYSALTIIEISSSVRVNYYVAIAVNTLVFFILCFMSYYAMLLIAKIVHNIFNFGQMLNLYISIDFADSKEVEDSERKKDEEV